MARQQLALLDVEISMQDGVATLALVGELDLSATPMLRELFVQVFEHGQHTSVVVDARRLDFLDSTGIGVLVGARNRALARGGDLKITNASPRIVKVLTTTGLTAMLAEREHQL